MTTPTPASGERVATRDQMLSRGWMGSPRSDYHLGERACDRPPIASPDETEARG